jgi:tripartite-type tricarboxylate transporter receptor subunit TctC
MVMKRRGLLAAFGALSLAWLASSPAIADEAPSLAGKTITMTIGFGAGGSVDLYGRTLGQYLVQHLPGKPSLVVLNQLGAGGVVALNSWAVKAEPNGLYVTIGAESQTDPDALFRTQAKYDTMSLNYVGGLSAYSQGLFVAKDAVARLTDKSQKPVLMGLVGSTLRSGNYGVFWGAAVLGWNIKWVRGYPSTSELRQALERGEIDMSTFGSSRDIKSLDDTGNFKVVIQGGTVKDGKRVPRAAFGSAPILADLVKGKITDPLAQKAFDYSENVSQVGMWLALPPKTPKPIVDAYIKAFNDTLKDPGYQADFAKIDPDSLVASKTDIEALVGKLHTVSPQTVEYIQDEMKRLDVDQTK